VRIGPKGDAEFLAEVADEMDGIDVVPDDGSHRMEDIAASLRVLFPFLEERGV